MKIKEYLKALNELYPYDLSLNFDNVGLLLGNDNQECTGIVICLDITNDCISFAKKHKANLIISHHPLIFNPLKKIEYNSSLLGNKIHKLIENNTCVYAIHTNFDAHFDGMNKAVFNKIKNKLDVSFEKYIEDVPNSYMIPSGIGSIYTLKKPIKFKKLFNTIDSSFKINSIRGYDSKKLIKRFAICPGSGKSEVYNILNEKVDCFISSDIPYNNILDLIESNISYIDATHNGLEGTFVSYLYTKLNKLFNINKIYKYE